MFLMSMLICLEGFFRRTIGLRYRQSLALER
jgi:hypothetical protein